MKLKPEKNSDLNNIIIIIIYSIYRALIPNGPKALYIIRTHDPTESWPLREFTCILHLLRVYCELSKWPAPIWLDSSVGRALSAGIAEVMDPQFINLYV